MWDSILLSVLHGICKVTFVSKQYFNNSLSCCCCASYLVEIYIRVAPTQSNIFFNATKIIHYDSSVIEDKGYIILRTVEYLYYLIYYTRKLYLVVC